MGKKVALDFGRVTFDATRSGRLNDSFSFTNGMFTGSCQLDPEVMEKVWKQSAKDVRFSNVIDNGHYYVVIEPIKDHSKNSNYYFSYWGKGIVVYCSD